MFIIEYVNEGDGILMNYKDFYLDRQLRECKVSCSLGDQCGEELSGTEVETT